MSVAALQTEVIAPQAATPAVAPVVGPTRYRAFISYCHRDDKVASWLHRQIETYRVPRAIVGHDSPYGPVPRRLGKVFRDEEELGGAAELGPQLEGALRDSAALIVICSKDSAKSYWVDHEVRFFKQINPERPVLAVIANGVPGSADAECFPMSLRYHVDAEGDLLLDQPAEPLAPDLTKLDRDAVKLKLIAGLLGVGYDELARRDLRRERRRIALLSSAGLLVTLAFAALALAALGYAQDAIRQRDRAEAAQLLAERNAEEADRKAWLAQTAAEEIRRQAEELGKANPAQSSAPGLPPPTPQP
jgi:hypothetical protein